MPRLTIPPISPSFRARTRALFVALALAGCGGSSARLDARASDGAGGPDAAVASAGKHDPVGGYEIADGGAEAGLDGSAPDVGADVAPDLYVLPADSGTDVAPDLIVAPPDA